MNDQVEGAAVAQSNRCEVADIPCVVAIGVTVVIAQGAGRVLKLEELTYTDIDRLDRNRTVFILTFGNLEEHGPHLPVGSDYFQAIAFRDGV